MSRKSKTPHYIHVDIHTGTTWDKSEKTPQVSAREEFRKDIDLSTQTEQRIVDETCDRIRHAFQTAREQVELAERYA